MCNYHRVFRCVLAFCLLISAIVLIPVQAAGSAYFEDSFEDRSVGAGLSSVWEELTGTEIKTVIAEAPGNSSGKSVKFQPAAGEAAYFIQSRDLFQCSTADDTTVLSFSMFLPEVLGAGDQVMVTVISGKCTIIGGDNRNDVHAQPVILSGAEIQDGAGRRIKPSYPVNRWFTIRCIFSNATGTYSMVLVNDDGNEETLVTDYAFNNPPFGGELMENGLRRVRFSLIQGAGSKLGAAYLDDIKVYNTSSITSGEAMAEIPKAPQDVMDDPHAYAIEALYGLGLTADDKEGAFAPEKPKTRGAFVKDLMELIQVPLRAEAETGYADVPSGHAAAGAIEAAAGLGLVSKGERFRPDDAITKSEAMKILLDLMGYQEMAKAAGGYPNGYLIEAARNGLDRNLSLGGEEALTRGDAAQLVYNTFDVKVMEQIAFGDEVRLSAKNNQTLLNLYRGIYQETGVVETAGSRSLYIQQAKLGSSQVRIGGTVKTAAVAGLEDCIAQEIQYYYTKNGSVDEICYYRSRDTVKTYNFAQLTAESPNQLRLNEGNRLVSVGDSIPILYNGMPCGERDFAQLIRENGEVQFIYSRSGTLRAVNVTGYRVYVVSNISPNTQSISDKITGETLTLSGKEEVGIKLDGVSVPIYKVKENDVLLIKTERLPYHSDLNTAKYLELTVVRSSVKGKLDSMREGRMSVSGREYEVLDTFNKDAIGLGDDASFLLDQAGQIVYAIDVNRVSGDYAVLLGCSLDGSFKDRLIVQLLGVSGVKTEYQSQDKIWIDGVKCGAQAAFDKLTPLIRNEVVMVEYNLYGEVRAIRTAEDMTAKNLYLGYTEGSFTKDYANASFTYDDYVISPYCSFDSHTVLFVGSDEGDDLFYCLPPEKIWGYDGAAVKIYDITPKRTAGVILVKTTKAELEKISNQVIRTEIAVVQSVATAVDAAQEKREKLIFLSGGMENELFINEDAVFAQNSNWSYMLNYSNRPIQTVQDLRFGDIIQIETNAAGEIKLIHVLYNADMPYDSVTPEQSNDGSASYISPMSTLFGRVGLKDGTIAVLESVPGRNIDLAGANVYIVSQSRKNILKGTPADVAVGTQILVRNDRFVTKEVVILED